MRWNEFEVTREEWTHGKIYDLSIADTPQIYADDEKLLVVVEALIEVDDNKEYVKMGVGFVDLIKDYIDTFDIENGIFDDDDKYKNRIRDDLSRAIRDLQKSVDILTKIKIKGEGGA